MAKRMRRIYRAKNGVVDGSDFWIADSAQPRRRKTGTSSPRKQEANRNQAVHILARKLNNNFSQGDLFFTLTYSGSGWIDLRSRAYRQFENLRKAKKEEKRDAILFEAEKDGKLLLRRLREAGLKDFKYVILGSDMDGTTGNEARVHLHLVISGEGWQLVDKKLTLRGDGGRSEAGSTIPPLRRSPSPASRGGKAGNGGRSMEELWGHGAVEYEFLRGGSYNKLAAYLLRQTRDIKNHKKYVCSRNLEAIEYEEFEIGPNEAPLRAPAGATVEEYQNDPTNPYGMVYIRYVEPVKETRRKKRE